MGPLVSLINSLKVYFKAVLDKKPVITHVDGHKVIAMSVAIVVIFFVTMIVIFWVWLSIVFWSLRNGISPMPTAEKVKRKVLAAIPPETQGTVIDLGSGWGNMAHQIAKALPHCQVLGYESSPIPYLFSRLWQSIDRQANLQFLRRDFFKLPLEEISLIYCYLYPDAMKKLATKFNEELKPGTVIISNTFALPGWEPVEVLQTQDAYHTRIYLYVKSTSNVDALYAQPQKISKQPIEV